jgi:hypothetical protein
MIHHPDRGTFPSIAILITGQVGQFWKAHPGHFSKAPKSRPLRYAIKRLARENCPDPDGIIFPL